MQLILFRHGIAEPRRPEIDDATRELTEEGVERTRLAARGLLAFADAPDVILTSPKIRAAQTAAIAGEALGREVETLTVLAEDDARAIIDALAQREESAIMIVGHEPTFSTIVERLCAPSQRVPFIELKKAGAACIEVEREDDRLGSSTLLWLATPKMLRALARA